MISFNDKFSRSDLRNVAKSVSLVLGKWWLPETCVTNVVEMSSHYHSAQGRFWNP